MHFANSIKSANFDSHKKNIMRKQHIADTQLSLFDNSDFEIEDASESIMVVKEKGVNEKQNKDGIPLELPKKKNPQEQITKIPVLRNSSSAYDFRPLFYRLSQSSFRSGFHLHNKERAYIDTKGLDIIRQHAADFIAKRLAPAVIPNDGKQTPMRGHPVFIAQHATGCCCRGCFSKWHHIPAGRLLTQDEQNYAVEVIMTWITKEYKSKE